MTGKFQKTNVEVQNPSKLEVLRKRSKNRVSDAELAKSPSSALPSQRRHLQRMQQKGSLFQGQGDPLAMCMYAVNLQPLISCLQEVIQAKQCWFAGDATGCGLLQDIRCGETSCC